MFTNPVFENLIHPVKLTFTNPKLEAFYQNSISYEYLKRFSPFYMVLLSLAMMSFISLIPVPDKLVNAKTREAWATIICDIIHMTAIASEFTVSVCRSTRRFRAIPFVLLTLIAAAVVNSLKLNLPAARPGYPAFWGNRMQNHS